MHKYSNFFVRTLKEPPRDVDTISHQLMVRAGMIRKVASGIYTILPMGLRVFSKLNQIIREEMTAIDGVECAMPHVVPSELWKESGRWDQYGKELLRMDDRSGREFCFGPTHEEVITDFVSALTNSYKQLPLLLYQIQTKFRDEVRPRFGLMRGREFLMKDAYSFHDSQESLDDCYNQCRQAYSNIFSRCDLNFIEAKADSGSIGGDVSVEFLVIADTGEDEVLVNKALNYAANVEAAQCVDIDVSHDVSNIPSYSDIQTPNAKSIDDVSNLLSIDRNQTLKSLVVMDANEQPVLLCLRGDRLLNEAKVKSLMGGAFRFSTDEEVQSLFQCPVGFIGPVGSTVRVVLDYSLKTSPFYICGANKKDYHLNHVVVDRDILNYEWADIRNAESGDPCPLDPSQPLKSQRGIEVGHVFKLGTKYSNSMNRQFTTQTGTLDYFEMGCYGIGVGRTIAAAIEQSYDDNGIVWPRALAPFDISIINLAPKEDALNGIVDQLYDQLTSHDFDVIVDDRVESPGVKFKDADLIGFPFQVIIGKKTLETNELEIKIRKTNDRKKISIDLINTLPEVLI